MIDLSTLRVALRTLTRHRGFTIVAVVSLALAIALNTTMYSAVDAMFDPHIKARQPDHVYSLNYYGDFRRQLAPGTIEDALKHGLQGFQDVTGGRRSGRYWQSPLAENGPRYSRVTPIVVRMNYFDFLGAPALEGRTFLPRDENEANAVISDRLAAKLYPDETPIGRSILLDGNGYTVIGVVERNSTFSPLAGDVWIPRPANTPPVAMTLIRFREKIDRVEIGALLEPIAARLAAAAGDVPGKTGFWGSEMVIQRFKVGSFHWALAWAVVAVLLVACANLANLQLARGLARHRELALRSAVGASRRQLIGHLVMESGLLAFGGLVLGVVLTLWGIQIVRSSIPPEVMGLMVEPQTSWKMFVFAAAASIVCLFLVGLLPSLHVSKVDPDSLLRASAGTGANREHRRRYGTMVIAQIGLALPVLIGAIVVLRGAMQLHDFGHFIHHIYGYDPAPIVAANVPVASPEGTSVLRIADVASQLVSSAKSVAGVTDAAAYYPRRPIKNMVTVDDANGVIREEPAHQWEYKTVSPSYFRVMGRSMERGRAFRDGEYDGTSVIMDARSARYLWGNHNPIGRAIKFGDSKSDEPWGRVVGIIGDMRDTFWIRRTDPYANYRLAEVFRVITPADSVAFTYKGLKSPAWATGTVIDEMRRARASVTLYARTQGNTELAAVRLQRQLRSLKSTESPSATPLEDQLGISTWRVRQDFVASLFSTFALLGLGLVAIGVYGIVSHAVAERRRELAVRISLGATARNILHSVLREGNALILGGLAIGLFLTKYTVMWLGQYFNSENEGYNAPLFAAIAIFLFALAAFAAFIPAWRATRIDPVEALRHE